MKSAPKKLFLFFLVVFFVFALIASASAGTQKTSSGVFAPLQNIVQRADKFVNQLSDQLFNKFKKLFSFKSIPSQKLLAQISLTDGLVGYWKFDEGSGTTAADSSGNGNNATLKNGVAWATGKVGGALSFDGSNDYVSVLDNANLRITGDITISLWMKKTSEANDWVRLVGKGISPPRNYGVWEETGAGKRILWQQHNSTGGSVLDFFSQSSIEIGNWYFITTVVSGTNAYIYINGGLDASGTRLGTPGTSSDPVTIGYAGFYTYFSGLIDDVRIYNRALTSTEIRSLVSDVTGTTVTITSPADNSSVDGIVTITVDASDSDGIAGVQFKVDGVNLGTEITTPPYTTTWDSTKVGQGTHTISAYARDGAGNTTPSSIKIIVDRTPLLLAVNSYYQKTNQISIQWMTDEPADTQVEYGPDTNYGLSTTLDSSLVYIHSQTITGLTPGTRYNFRVKSKDAGGKLAVSDNYTFATLTSTPGNEFYVSPTGTAGGNGSITNPWDLQTALNHPTAVKPGDTIWLRGGTYLGSFTSKLKGTETAPIIVRQYPGERATLENTSGGISFSVGGYWTWYWGFEITSSYPNRVSTQTGSSPTDINTGGGINAVTAPNTKFINLIVHDNTGNGICWWTPTTNSELYGNIIYYNGWIGPGHGHAHAIYTQNNTGVKRLLDNIMFDGLSYGLHAYTEGGQINNFYVEGNVAFKNNFLIGGGQIAQNPQFISNYSYPGQGTNLGYSAGCNYPVVQNNYLAGGITFVNCTNITLTGNTIKGTALPQFPQNTYYTTASPPTNNVIFVRPNQYESGRANITVYNWENKNSVDVNVSNVLSSGDYYEVRDVQNYFGTPVATGTYSGGTISIPMTSTTVAQVVGNIPQPSHSSIEFGVFVLLKTTAPPLVDTTPPVLSAGSPSGTLPSGTTQTTLSLTTSESATCKYSTTAGASYASMTGIFSTTGGTSHSTDISGLTGGSYNYYIRCKDSAGNANASDYTISFSINPVAVSISSPSSGSTVSGKITVSAAASSNVAIAGIQLKLNSFNLGTEAASSPYNYTFDTTTVANGAYALTAVARDTAGNSTTSSAVSMTINNVPAYYYFEAESGTLASPMAIASHPLAFGGQYIFTPIGNSGSLSLTVNLSAAGTYILWGRILSPDFTQDSFFVSVDGGTEDIWDTAEKLWSPDWQWTRVTGRTANGLSDYNANPRLFDLSAGNHTFVFRGRDKNTFFDRLLITNVSSFVPTSTISTTPTPTPTPSTSPGVTPTPTPSAGTATPSTSSGQAGGGGAVAL